MAHSDNMSSALFPIPSSPPSPPTFPGASPQSTESLLTALKANNENHHIYYNEQRYHNHVAHHVLTLWALGADANLIQSTYNAIASYQKPRVQPPEPITAENFSDHLGDDNFYSAYYAYFADLVLLKDPTCVLEDHLFSPTYNYSDPARKGSPLDQQPRMLDRFVSGLLHPLIHTGHGVEFGIPGIIAEGLAQAAIHPASHATLFSPIPFQTIASNLIATSTTSSANVHALSIVARILQDPKLKPDWSGDEPGPYAHTLESKGELIKGYVEQWTLDVSRSDEIQRKIEELIWTNVVIYAVGGYHHYDTTAPPTFKADFFLMHLVTSSIFLHSLSSHLSPCSNALLLRAYFAVSLAVWVSRGRPALDIRSFMANASPSPSPPSFSASTTATKDALKHGNPNPWFLILRAALVHPDAHTSKIQRTLAHFATLYGKRTSMFSVPDEVVELEGAELLDGSLFVRAAGLTADAVGWVRGEEWQGQEPREWDRSGFASA